MGPSFGGFVCSPQRFGMQPFWIPGEPAGGEGGGAQSLEASAEGSGANASWRNGFRLGCGPHCPCGDLGGKLSPDSPSRWRASAGSRPYPLPGDDSMKRIILSGIRLYQRTISRALPASCRFYPSCSEYAWQAVERYGWPRGSWLTLRRLVRCHPFHPGGYDPVK